MLERRSYLLFLCSTWSLNLLSPKILGITFCGSVVEQTSSILSSRMLFTYFVNSGSFLALYTSIQPHREPGQGSSLEMPFIEIPHTLPITSASGIAFFPL